MTSRLKSSPSGKIIPKLLQTLQAIYSEYTGQEVAEHLIEMRRLWAIEQRIQELERQLPLLQQELKELRDVYTRTDQYTGQKNL